MLLWKDSTPRRAAVPLLLFFALAACGRKPVQPRETVSFDDGWKFFLGDTAAARLPEFDDSAWRTVHAPHDWSIELPVAETNPSGTAGGYFAGGVGWYRKEFLVPDAWAGKSVSVVFDGIYRDSEVWVNGTRIGGRASGTVSHHYDITAFVKPGTNVMAVRVNASVQPYDRWYSGAGLFRHVRLHVTDPLHVPVWGTAVTFPKIDAGGADVRVKTRVRNATPQAAACRIKVRILDSRGRTAAEADAAGAVAGNGEAVFVNTLRVERPALWSPETPVLYSAEATVTDGERVVDAITTVFGFRTVRFTPDSGLILNGVKTVMKGVCLHHDGGCVGAAVPERVWERRFEILKSLGVNAIRFAHNPHAPEALDLCDRMGFLVFDEWTDKWAIPWQDEWWKGWNGSRTRTAAEFHSNWKQDLRDFIERDRNHPSVLVWSVGNETIEQLNAPAAGVRILDSLVQWVHSLDPSRPVTCALHPGTESDGHEVPSRFILHMDVASANYRTAEMEAWHREYPNLSWISSETKASREDAPADWADVDFSNNSWFSVKSHVAGQFIWAGIDYLGETRGWPDKGCRAGMLSTAGFVKPYAYYNQSLYTDRPMVHVAVLDDSLVREMKALKTWQISWYGAPVSDHWTFPEKQGKKVSVFAFTNCETVDLTLNGRSLGEKSLRDFADRAIQWQVTYEPGLIAAIGRNGDREVCRHVLETAGEAVRIDLKADRVVLAADGRDVAHVEVRVSDKKGVTVPAARHRIRFRVDGPASLLAADNGDLADHTPYAKPVREARNGRCLALILAGSNRGIVRVHAEADGLESRPLVLQVE